MVHFINKNTVVKNELTLRFILRLIQHYIEFSNEFSKICKISEFFFFCDPKVFKLGLTKAIPPFWLFLYHSEKAITIFYV